jgi:hypothetical protein
MIQSDILWDLLEQVSEEVHNSWWQEKAKQGFHSPIIHGGDKFTKVCDKCHPDMYPYNELS